MPAVAQCEILVLQIFDAGNFPDVLLKFYIFSKKYAGGVPET